MGSCRDRLQDLGDTGGRPDPCGGGGTDTSRHDQNLVQPLLQRLRMNRLVMGDAVAQRMQPLDAVVDLSTDTRTKVWKGVAERGCPQRRLMARIEQIPPEAEHQLRDDPVLRLGSATLASASASVLDLATKI